MKRFLLLALILAAAWAPLRAAEFGYPVAGEPWYSIRTEFTDVSTLSKGAWRVSRVRVNGTRVRDFVLYQGGGEVLGPEVRGR